jgi:hypothetical protein
MHTAQTWASWARTAAAEGRACRVHDNFRMVMMVVIFVASLLIDAVTYSLDISLLFCFFFLSL